jgi:hypothetical protein
MSVNLLDQYKELCSDCRNREAHAWVVPTASFTWTALVFQVLVNTQLGINFAVISIINILVFSSLFLLFVRWSLYQLAAQRAIKKILKKRAFSNFIPVAQYMELDQEAFQEDGVVIRFFARQSSTRVLYFAFFVIGIAYLAILIWAFIALF